MNKGEGEQGKLNDAKTLSFFPSLMGEGAQQRG